MSARRSQRPAVSLFEFLAVLVCAMGALILLLLVTTRRIRQHALEEALAAQPPSSLMEPESGATVTEAITVPLIELAQSDSDAPAWQLARLDESGDDRFAGMLPTPSLEVPWPEPEPPQPDPYVEAERLNAELRREWLARVSQLEQQAAALEATWNDWQQTLITARQAVEQVTGHAREIDQRMQRLGQQEILLAERASQINRSRARLEEEINGTAERLQDLRHIPPSSPSRFSILPYDYASGTTRRPIVIECTADTIRFASEEVTLRASDIHGFTPAYNPLQGGAEALIEYWRQHDPHPGAAGDPYLLLVVRPGGTISYYIARKLLENVDERFGYELVGNDQEFVWPETTPEAVRVCREAVEARIAERNRVLARMGGSTLPIAGPLRFMDAQGNFYLEEVDQLREPLISGTSSSAGTDGSTSATTSPGRRILPSIFGGEVSSRPVPSQPPQQRDPSPQGRPDGSGTWAAAPPTHQGDAARAPSTGGGSSSTPSTHPNPGSSESAAGSRRNTQPQQPSGTPSWIERSRTPDRSPSFQTHPGLFGGRERTSTISGHQGPLVIDTASPSQPLPDAPRTAPSPGAHVLPRSVSPPGSVDLPGTATPFDPVSGETMPQAPPFGEAGTGSGTGTSSLFEPVFDRAAGPSVNSLTPPDLPGGRPRDLYVYIDDSSFQVAGEPAVAIHPGMSREDLERLLADRLNARMATWEALPPGSTWVPHIRFEIRRGGNTHLRQLAEIIGEWNVNWTANYTTVE